MVKKSIKQRYLKRLKTFGAAIRRIRRMNDVTQEELADISGVSINSINTLESGKLNPTFATIIAISDALGVSPKEFFEA